MNKIAKRKVIFIFLSVIVMIISIVIVTSPKIKGRLYPGDNIKIDFTLSVNNQEVSLDNASITLLRNGKETSIIPKDGVIKAKGKEYGEYYFKVVINSDKIPNYDKDIVINLKYINANKWYISNSECKVVLNTSPSGTISGESTVDVKYNDGSSDKYNQDIEMDNNEININWGM